MVFLGKKRYRVTRKATGSYVEGDWVDGEESTFTIEASIQPATGQELALLPEGARKTARHKMYTSTQLMTVNLHRQTTPDVVCTHEGIHHVHMVADWLQHQTGVPHYKYILIRKGVDVG